MVFLILGFNRIYISSPTTKMFLYNEKREKKGRKSTPAVHRQEQRRIPSTTPRNLLCLEEFLDDVVD